MGVMQIVEDDRETATEDVKPVTRSGKAVKRWHIDHHTSCSFPSTSPLHLHSPAFVPDLYSRGTNEHDALSIVRPGIYSPGPKAASHFTELAILSSSTQLLHATEAIQAYQGETRSRQASRDQRIVFRPMKCQALFS